MELAKSKGESKKMKNKKGLTGFAYFTIFICSLIVILMILFIFDCLLRVRQEDACERIGYEKSIIWGEVQQACKDYNGDIIFIKFDNCKFFRQTKCIAKPIKVGEVWGIGDKP